MLTRLAVALTLLVFSLDCAAAITGFVLDEDGRPVANAAVTIYEDETPDEQIIRMLAGKQRESFGAATTADDGAFSISPDDTRGPIVVQAVAPGHLPAAIAAQDGDRIGSLLLARAEVRKGKVRAAGKPLPDAAVFIEYAGGEQFATTAADGTFMAPWSDTPQSVRRLIVVHPKHAVHSVGAPVRGLDLTMPVSTSLRGRVIGPDGKTGVENVLIRVDAWPLATSAADGSFTIERAPSQWSRIVAEHETGVAIHSSTFGPPALLRLQAGVVVHGRVVDAASRRGLAGAVVSVNGPAYGSVVRTRADGGFEARALDPQQVHASYPGYVPEFATPDASGTADFALDRAATVTGTIVSEANEPVAGALAVSWPDGFTYGSNFMHASARSGGDGRFMLRVAPDQPQTIEVTKTAMPTVQSESLRLAAGAARDVRIAIPAGIEVSGTVRDADGHPLRGVEVQAERDEKTSGRRSSLQAGSLRTAADGTYSLRLTEGTYTFSFSGDAVAKKNLRGQRIASGASNVIDVTLAPSFAIEGQVVQGGEGVRGAMIAIDEQSDPARTHADHEGRFTLRGLERGTHWVVVSHRMLRHRIQLGAPVAGVVIELPEGGTIVGKVVDRETGASISSFRAGFAINRSGISGSSAGSGPLLPFDSADGSFRIEHVPTGTADVVVEAAGFVQGQLKVIVEAGKEHPVTLALERGARLSGRVTAEGGSLGDVTVSLQPVLRNGGSFQLRKVKTDAAGAFVFDGLARDEWALTFEHREYAPLVRNVVVREDETTVEIALSRGTDLTGIVVANSGEPLADAQVVLFSQNARNVVVRTGPDGTFRMQNAPAGPHRLRVEKPGFVATTRPINVPSDTLRIELGRGATIFGRIIGLAPEALTDARVHVLSRAGTAISDVHPDGTYSVEGAPPGEARIRATLRGSDGERISGTTTLQIAEGVAVQHDLVFAAGFSVDGNVLLNGKPLPAARVTFVDDASGNAASTRADASGSFRIGDLTSGTYTVEVLDDVTFASHSTQVEISGPRRIEIAFSAHRVRGRVFYAGTSEVVQNASVILEPRSGPRRQGIRTGTGLDGTFVFEFVPPGPWQLRVEKDGCETAAFAFEVDAQIRPIELRIGRSAVK